MSQFVKVVIVGAGPSGLKIAGILDSAGVSVVVLEANDRIGGRLLTVKPGVDLGATWFWQNEKDVFDVISECGLKTFPQFVNGDAMYQSSEGVVRLKGNPLDQKGMRISGGMQTLAQALADKLPEDSIKLGTRVSAIEIQAKIKVSSNSGEWISDSVVLAVAPSTALSNINFSPSLPQELTKIASRTPVWMGAMRKVVAIYDTPFWRENGLAGSAISHVGPLREIHDISDESGSFGALFGFSPVAVTKSEAISQLVHLFGSQAAVPNSLLIQDWSLSELISPPNVSELTDYQLFGSKVLCNAYFDNRLYFTSTETATDSAGHIQGALSAAQRTAGLILNSLNQS